MASCLAAEGRSCPAPGSGGAAQESMDPHAAQVAQLRRVACGGYQRSAPVAWAGAATWVHRTAACSILGHVHGLGGGPGCDAQGVMPRVPQGALRCHPMSPEEGCACMHATSVALARAGQPREAHGALHVASSGHVAKAGHAEAQSGDGRCVPAPCTEWLHHDRASLKVGRGLCQTGGRGREAQSENPQAIVGQDPSTMN